MAFYPRYRRRRFGRRYGGRRYWRRNWYRRNGVKMFSSQKQGTRRFSLMIPVEGSVTLNFGGTAGHSDIIGFTPFYNDTSSGTGMTQQKRNAQMNIMDSEVFAMYVRLYDEMKLNGVVYNFRVSGVPNSAVAGSIYTSIDRHATARDLSIAKSYNEVVQGVEHQRFDFTSLDKAIFTRSFWSRDLMEKAVFMDSTCHTLADHPSAGIAAPVVEDWYSYGRGGFVPLLYMCVNSAGFTGAGSTMTIQCTANYYITFRNPKFKTATDRSVRSESEPVETKIAGKSSSESKIEKKFTDEELDEVMEKLKSMGLIEEKEEDELMN